MNLLSRLLATGALTLLCACSESKPDLAPAPAQPAIAAEPAHYSMDDFAHVRKFDAHVHVNVTEPAFLEQARDDGFELMSINVDYPDFPKLADQRAAALAQLRAQDAYKPARIHWATTFSMKGFGKPDWAGKVNTGLAADAGEGAKAVKIWKNVGMQEKAAGKLIMLDDA